MTGSTPSVLFVCTANIVRSPIAVALLNSRLRDGGVEAFAESAGVRASPSVLDNGALMALDMHGIDLRRHRSRVLDVDMVRLATLILGLEREHVRETVLMDSYAWPRTFTLKEIVRRGEATGVRAQHESLDGWIARAHAGRTRHELLGADPIDDVADPYGRAPGDYEDAAEEISDLVARLVGLVWPRALEQPL